MVREDRHVVGLARPREEIGSRHVGRGRDPAALRNQVLCRPAEPCWGNAIDEPAVTAQDRRHRELVEDDDDHGPSRGGGTHLTQLIANSLTGRREQASVGLDVRNKATNARLPSAR